MDTKRITECAKAAEDIAGMLYANNVSDAQQFIGDTVKNINNIYLEYINKADELRIQNIDVPADVLLLQMNNLMEAIDNKDIIMLADTMLYEIKEGLLFFIDIEKELGGIRA